MKFIYYKIFRCPRETYSKFISGAGPKEKKRSLTVMLLKICWERISSVIRRFFLEPFDSSEVEMEINSVLTII
jgi:hypothetical protein